MDYALLLVSGLTGYGFFVLFPGLILKNRLQELYLYGTNDTVYTVQQYTFAIYCPLDGWFKKLSCVFEIDATTGYNAFVQGWVSLYRTNNPGVEIAGSGKDPRDIQGSHNFVGQDVAYGVTLAKEYNPYWMPMQKDAGDMSGFRAHISREVHKYDAFTLEWNYADYDETAYTQGIGSFYWEITYVLAPSMADPYKSDLEPLSMVVHALFPTGVQNYLTMVVPSSGYLTNACMSLSSVGEATAPCQVLISPNLNAEYVTNEISMSSSSDQREAMSGNCFSVTTPSDQGMHCLYYHWGRHSVKISSGQMLYFVIANDDTDVVIFWFFADFVPFVNARFVTLTAFDTNVDTSTNFTDGFVFPVDMKNVTIQITGYVSTGDGLVAFRLMQDQQTFLSSVNTAIGDLELTTQGDLNNANTQFHDSGIIGLQAMNSTEPTINIRLVIPSVKAYSFLAMDLVSENTLAWNCKWLIQGTVKKQKFSKGSYYPFGTGVLDITPMMRKTNVSPAMVI